MEQRCRRLRAVQHRKGDRLLAEIGWRLARRPAEPPPTVAVVLGWTARDPAWDRYLQWAGAVEDDLLAEAATA